MFNKEKKNGGWTTNKKKISFPSGKTWEDYIQDIRLEISCGEAHCVAIIKTNQTYDKNVWSWGNNRYGQLGLGNTIDCSLPKPNTYLIEYKNNKFESVSCGGFHSLCLINSTDNINWIEDDFKNIICKIINDIGII